jgi:RNA polymerase sigma-70 factor (ECF subfamily)
MITSARTSLLQGCVDRLGVDDGSARDELIAHSCQRLRVISRSLLRQDRLRRFVDTDDVLHGAVIVLRESLGTARPASVAEYLRLAAFQIRRELVRLARHYYGPTGWGTRHILTESWESWRDEIVDTAAGCDADARESMSLAEDVAQLQSAVEALPADLRDVVDLLWLHGLSQREVAEVLDVSERTVRRRWVRARLRLHGELSGRGFSVVTS